MSFEVHSEGFWKEDLLEKEVTRVYDICNGCRRCFNLCPSFNVLFRGLDTEAVDGEAEKLPKSAHEEVVDLCFECKLCFNHCPYTPPHRWDLDFPRTMLRAKLVAKKDGVTVQDRFLGDPDRIGTIGKLTAPIFNALNRNGLSRRLLAKLVGIHESWPLPPYHAETWKDWFAKRKGRAGASAPSAPGASSTSSAPSSTSVSDPPSASRKVAFFATCSVNYSDLRTGKDAVQVLERSGVQVRDGYARCCGMPALDGGDLPKALAAAKENLRVLGPMVEQGYDVVAPGPTCSYVLKQEYPLLVPTEESRKVAARTYDLAEYLMQLHQGGALDTRFANTAGKVAYQMPCHLRAQNLGYKSRDLMMLAGAKVRTVERCSGVDGTWGMKTQFHQISMDFAKPMLAEISAPGSDTIATDCPLSALRIREGTGREAVHPVSVVARAYGIPEDGKGSGETP